MTSTVTDRTGTPLLLDVNVLVALALSSHQHHRSAHDALDMMKSWATTPFTEAALVRLLLNPSVVGRQLAGADVLSQLRAMRGDARWCFLSDHTSLGEATIDLTPLVSHAQVTDFHLVNVAAVHEVRLATFDRALLAALAPADRRHVELLPLR